MLTVRVTKSGTATDFMVPEKTLCAASLVIDAAMREPRSESEERVFLLTDFGHDTVGAYIRWLLTGKLFIDHESQHDLSNKTRSEEDPDMRKHYCLLDEICALQSFTELGHYLLDIDFRDTISDAILQTCTELEQIEADWILVKRTNSSMWYLWDLQRGDSSWISSCGHLEKQRSTTLLTP